MLLCSTVWYNLLIGLKPSDVICESVLYCIYLERVCPTPLYLEKLIVSKAKLTSDIFIGQILSRLIQFYHYDLNKLTATKAGFGQSSVLQSCVNVDDKWVGLVFLKYSLSLFTCTANL